MGHIRFAEILCSIYWLICGLEYLNISEILYNVTNKNKFFFKILPYIFFICAILILFKSSSIPFLLISLTILYLFKALHGPFNGGSDYIHFLTTISLCLFHFFSQHQLIVKGILLYLSIQVILSYFIAGFVKIKNLSWRNGSALSILFLGPNFCPPKFSKILFSNKIINLITAWIIIGFELCSPILLITNHKLSILIFLGFFHFLNFLFFGLNRFFFSWIITYPLLISAF